MCNNALINLWFNNCIYKITPAGNTSVRWFFYHCLNVCPLLNAELFQLSFSCKMFGGSLHAQSVSSTPTSSVGLRSGSWLSDCDPRILCFSGFSQKLVDLLALWGRSPVGLWLSSLLKNPQAKNIMVASMLRASQVHKYDTSMLQAGWTYFPWMLFLV